MIVYYDLETKEIKRTEDNTMEPILPFNMTMEEKLAYYKSEGESFVAIPYEMGVHIFDYKLCFDADGNFVGLQPLK